MQYFDSDNKIPVYGFGAKLPPNHNIVSHCFSFKGNYFKPLIEGGAENVLKLYRKRLRDFKLHGPTALSLVIKAGIDWAKSIEVTNEK